LRSPQGSLETGTSGTGISDTMAKKNNDLDPKDAAKDGPVKTSDGPKLVDGAAISAAEKAAGSKSGKQPDSGKTENKEKASSKVNSSAKVDSGGEKVSLAGHIDHAIQFFKEVVVEFKKISWPGRSQIIRETWSVLFLVAAITLMVLGFDWVLNHGVFMPLEDWARLHGGGYGGGFGQGPK
jgi:preprotein translocase SecE subunit